MGPCSTTSKRTSKRILNYLLQNTKIVYIQYIFSDLYIGTNLGTKINTGIFNEINIKKYIILILLWQLNNRFYFIFYIKSDLN